ncbi:caspase, EACC1-associated type [Actinophytocola xanthii]|uniref:Peptidase C14 caspase domain-containing protein n=1 Tax=Actinophytocola xanthii TaxID=1912961 RepID=A0A1Q8CXY8_9PSEU|nr:caspase family protein [Actinophytocola xanthii]OLF19223.1 hypothetical protein BU204_02405 [Actinophytocola xanthii]
MGRRLALLIATYEYLDPGLRRLTSPPHDAEALAEVLADPDIAGFEVDTLVNEPHHRVGEAIGELYRDCRRDDLVLLYFTGHGLKDDGGRLYLAMTNTRRDSLLFTALPAEQIDQAMSGCASRRQVLILDCCYSGAFPAGRLPKADPEVHALERFQGRGRTVLTASDSTQYSFEGNTPHGEAAQSVFTRHLVAGLRDGSADLDGDGDITLDELYGYVHERVVEEMPRQRPKRQDNVEGRTVIARNVNWTLPAYLSNALRSPIAADRLAALEGLDHLLRIGNESVRTRVREAIATLAEDDSKQVSSAATARYRALTSPPPAVPVPEPPATHTGPAPDAAATPAIPAEPGTAADTSPATDTSPAEDTAATPAVPAGPGTAADTSPATDTSPAEDTAATPAVPAGPGTAADTSPATDTSPAEDTAATPAVPAGPGTAADTSPATDTAPTPDNTTDPSTAPDTAPTPAIAAGPGTAATEPDPTVDTAAGNTSEPWFRSRRVRLVLVPALAATVVGALVVSLVLLLNRNEGSSGGSEQPAPLVSAMTVSPDGERLYLTSTNPPTLTVVDTVTRETVDQRELGAELAPGMGAGLAAHPLGERVFVTGFRTRRSLSVFRTHGMNEQTIPLDGIPVGVAFRRDGRTAYVITREPNTLQAVDTFTGTVRPGTVRLPEEPRDVAVDPTDQRVYIAAGSWIAWVGIDNGHVEDATMCGETVLASPTGSFWLGCAEKDRLSLVEPGAMTSESITVEAPADLALLPDNSRMYVPSAESDTVSVVDVATSSVAGPPIRVGPHPTAVAVDSSGEHVYVASDNRTISVIDPSTNSVSHTIDWLVHAADR